MSGNAIRAGILVAVVVAAAAFAGVTTAASSGSIEASPDEPGATATHTATLTIDGGAVGGSWTSFQVEYEATDVSNVGQNDVVTIGIDRDDDASGTTVDVNVSSDLSSVGAGNNGETLDVGLGGNYDLEQNDELVVVYENAQNPSSGDYTVTLHANYQSADETDTATLSIESDQTTTTQPTTTQSTTQTTSQPTTTQTTTTQSTTQTTSQPTTTQSTTQTTSQPTTTQTTSQPTTTQTTSDGGSGTTTTTDDGDDGGDVTTTSSGGGDGSDGSDGGDGSATTTDGGDGADDGTDNETDRPLSPSVEATPEEPTATATHAVTVNVDAETAGDSWNGLVVDYNGTGTNVSDVGQGDVVKLGIDRGDDATGTTVDVNVSSDLSSVDASNDGATLTVGLGGNYQLHQGDEVVVVYEDVQNPSAGIYQVPLDVNHQSSGGTATAPFALLSNDDATATTAGEDVTATAMPTETTDADAPATTADTTPSASPGFGTVAAALALLAGAALFARR